MVVAAYSVNKINDYQIGSVQILYHSHRKIWLAHLNRYGHMQTMKTLVSKQNTSLHFQYLRPNVAGEFNLPSDIGPKVNTEEDGTL